jgi:predicted aspartyl protease
LTLLSRTIARDLGLYGESPVSSALVNTAGGQVTVDVMKIGAIEVGGATVHNVPVAIFDLPDAPPSIEGLLGLSFLSHFLVTLDIKQNELRLTSR